MIHLGDLLTRMDETIGERLRKLRKAKNWTQVELAKASGVGQSAIGNIEAGTRGYGVSIVAIAKALDTNPEYLKMEKSNVPSVSNSDWPFELFTPAEYMLLSEKERHEFENSMAGAIMRIKKTKQAA